nr:hcr protein - woodchuck [Marmota monax]
MDPTILLARGAPLGLRRPVQNEVSASLQGPSRMRVNC